MGSLPRLKIKNDLNYRKGPTTGGCSNCNHSYEKIIQGIGQESLNRDEWRCRVIGDSESRRYRIHPDFICDRFENSRMLEHYNMKGPK